MSYPLINFCSQRAGAKIYCESPSFSDEYLVENLITNNEKGYLASSFIKPPIDITISFDYSIDLERVGVKCKAGTCISDTVSIYVSQESLDEMNHKMLTLLKERDYEMRTLDTPAQGHPKSMLSPPNQFLIPPNLKNKDIVSPYVNNNNNLNVDANKINLRSSGNLGLPKSQYLYDNVNLLTTTTSDPNLLTNKMAKQKYIHQQFKFVGTFDNLHLQDDLYTYVCNSNFKYPANQSLPSSFLQKVQRQSQLIPIHSNGHLLNSVKSIRIRILKVYQASCAGIGGIELWATPSPSTPYNIINSIYQSSQSPSLNPVSTASTFQNNLLSGFSVPNRPASGAVEFNMFPKVKHQQNQSVDAMKIDSSPHAKQSIIESFEEFLESHPEITLNETGIPTIFLDPITWELMSDPVTLKSGNVVDRSTIKTQFKHGLYTDPYTGLKISPDDLVTDYVLKSQIQAFIAEKKKRKRLLKSHSMILKNQILANLHPQIATIPESVNTAETGATPSLPFIPNPFQQQQDVNMISPQQQQQQQHILFNTNLFGNLSLDSIPTTSSSASSSLASSTSSVTSIDFGSNSSESHLLNGSGSFNYQSAETALSHSKRDPSQYHISKMPSQGSLLEMPIKKHRK